MTIAQMKRCWEKEDAIPISRLHEKFEYDEAGFLRSRRNGKRLGHKDVYGYVTISLDGKYHKEHRIIWAIKTGAWPSEYIDHIDRNRSNNKFENLRESCIVVNAQNSGIQENNTSGYTGVTFRKSRNRWVARVTVNGIRYTVGMHYRSPEAAAEARLLHLLNLGVEIPV